VGGAKIEGKCKIQKLQIVFQPESTPNITFPRPTTVKWFKNLPFLHRPSGWCKKGKHLLFWEFRIFFQLREKSCRYPGIWGILTKL